MIQSNYLKGRWKSRVLAKIAGNRRTSTFLLLLFLSLGLASNTAVGQASGYSFMASQGTYVALDTATATSTSLSLTADDALSNALPIGFTFNYAGTDYTQLKVSSNGLVCFGTGTSTTTNNLDQVSTTSTALNSIAPLWDDLRCTYGSYYQLSGSAPNRVLTLEFPEMKWRYNATTAIISFQVELHETTNEIVYIYNPINPTGATIPTASIGLIGGPSDFLSVSDATISATASTTSSSNSISTVPVSGLTFSFTPPSCGAIGILGVSNVTPLSADLSWSAAAAGTPSGGYYWKVVSAGAGSTATAIVDGVEPTATSTNISGLAASTSYDAYVYAICNPNDTSLTGSPFSFTTSCAPLTAPYSQDFNAFPNYVIPQCWDTAKLTTNTYAGAYTYQNTTVSTDRTLRYYNSSVAGAQLFAITPEFSDMSNTKRISFDVYDADGSMLIIGTVTDPTDISTFTPYDTLFDADMTDDVWENKIFEFANYTGSDKYIALECILPATYDYLYIDNFVYEEIPSCAEPAAPTAVALGTTTADISWTAPSSVPSSGYYWFVVASGAGSTATPVTSGVASMDTAFITGLSASTPYDFYVQSVCSTTDSSAITGPFSFATACATYTAPYIENFDASTSTPLCWTNQGAEPWSFAASGASGPGYGVAGSVDHTSGTGNFAWIDASGNINSNELISPLIDISSLTTPYVSCFLLSNNTNDAAQNELEIYGWDGTAWVLLTSYMGNNPDWVEVGITIPSTLPDTTKFRFVQVNNPGGSGSSYYNDLLVDDIEVKEAPTCFLPGGLQAVNVTPGGMATLTWTDTVNTSPAGYLVEWDTSGFAIGTGNMVYTTSDSLNITGLAPTSSYQFRVQVVCGPGDTSAWTGIVSFSTPCGYQTTPTVEEFSSFVPSCWEEGNGGDALTGPATTGSGDWTSDGFLNNGTSGAARINIYSSADRDWLISPSYSIPTGSSYYLQYNFGATDYASTLLSDAWESDDSVLVMISTNGSSWTELMSYNDQFMPRDFQQTEYIDLSSYAGQNVQIAFVSVEGTSDGTSDIDFFIDSFVIDVIPSCLDPRNLTASNLTQTDATLNWLNPVTGSVAGYNYLVVAAGAGTTGTPVSIGSTSNTTAMVSGLTSATDYDFYVQSNCGATSNPWLGPVHFTTPCGAYTAPYTYDVESASTTTSSVMSDCWSSDPSGSSSVYRWDIDGSGSTPTSSTGPSAAYSGSKYFYTEASSGGPDSMAYLYTPLIDISSLNTPFLEFAYHMYGSTMGNLYIEVWDGTSFQRIDSLMGQQQKAATIPWQLYGADLSPYLVSDSTQIRFVGQRANNYYGDISLDDISVVEAPSCLPPSSLVVDSNTQNGVYISWTAPANGASNYYWIAVPADSGYTSTNIVASGSSSTNSTTLTGLTSGVSYDFYVQTDCGTDSSLFTRALTVSPKCFETLPYFQDFEGATFATCWSKENTNGDSYTWSMAGQVPCFGAKSMRIDQNTAGHNDWVFSPYFAVTAGTEYTISFWFKSSDSSKTQKLSMYASSEQSSTEALAGDILFADLDIHNDTCQFVSISYTPTTSDPVTFGFWCNAAGSQGHIGFDNFSVETTPIAPLDTVWSNNNDDICNQYSVYGVTGNAWHELRNAAGDILLAINPNGNDLGNVSIDFEDRSAIQVWGVVGQPGTYKIVPRSWAITPQNQPASPVSVRFYYLGQELDAFNASTLGQGQSVYPATALTLTKQTTTAPDCDITNGGSGQTLPFTYSSVGTAAGTSDFYVETSVSSFSEFALHESSASAPLSIKIEDFRGEVSNSTIDLQWKATGVEPSTYISLEKLLDGEWKEIAQIRTHSDRNYNYVDPQPLRDNIYRLRYESEYSSVLNVRYISKSSVSIYPNPVVDKHLTVSVGENLGEKAIINIYDVLGRKVISQDLSLNNQSTVTEISLESVNAGNYFVEIVSDDASTIYNGVIDVK